MRVVAAASAAAATAAAVAALAAGTASGQQADVAESLGDDPDGSGVRGIGRDD